MSPMEFSSKPFGRGISLLKSTNSTPGNDLLTFYNIIALSPKDKSPKDKFIVTAKNEKITIWQFPSGKFVKKISGHKKDISALTFTPNGEKLLSFSGNDQTVKPNLNIMSK